MSHFIQNTGENSLANIINNLLPGKTKAMDFLVGYFYFSGIQEIYSNIEDKPMRILVGLDMDHELLSKTSEFDFFMQNQHPSSNKDIRDKFYSSLVNLFNQTNYFENDTQAEAFKIYYTKIKDGSLEIRKTLDPNHAKMYIFTYKDELTEDGETPGTVITGSSNFTYSGLRSNNEINVRFHTKDEFHDAQEIFNNLWDTATVIVDKDHINNFEEGVIKHIWYDKTPSPYLLYLRVLYEYFNLDESKHILTPAEITHGDFMNLKYQEDAIRIALDTIKRHNGAIVADVVGLGKSIIGSSIARNLNFRTIVVAPPHLTQQWEDYSFQFNFGAKVFSRGNLQKVLDYYLEYHREGETMLIIIDEAHSYRNEFIQDYAILHEICQNNKVLLLTATPFNNRPEDIYAMIKLFQIPTKSTLQTVDNLGAKFNGIIARYKKMRKDQRSGRFSDQEIKNAIDYIGHDIRKIISPLVIRRSRLDLSKIPAYKKDLENQGIEFPEVDPPTLKTYKLRNLKEMYLNTLETISPKNLKVASDFDDEDDYGNLENRIESDKPVFQAARYKSALYLKQESIAKVKKEVEEAGIDFNLFIGRQRSLSSFMRTLLVRRFESSQYAFKKSLELMLRNCLNIKNWIAKRNAIPLYKKGLLPNILDLYDSDDDTNEGSFDTDLENSIESLKAKGLFEIKAEYLDETFFKDLDSDICILQDLKNKWDAIGDDDDPKYDGFINLLTDQLQHDPKRKIVIFSQFADTVDYLGKRLKEDKFPVFVYTSKNASKSNKETIKANFDAGVKPSKQENEYSVLVATDAISEGYNLHRAGCIYNYDIPYNPTRVIQRVGRINRINKKVFDKLYIYNYFPTEIGEDETGIKQITTLKMAMIHVIMGEDTQYLTNEENLNSYFAEQYKQLVQAEEEESWDTPFRVLLEQLKNTPEMDDALKLPLRSKVRRLTTEHKSGVIAFARKNGDLVFKMAYPDGTADTLSPNDAFKIITAEKEEKGYPLSEAFGEMFNNVKHSLFVHSVEADKDKIKRDALDKVRIIARNSVIDSEYIEELRKAIELDAIAGYSLRAINRMKTKEFAQLPEIVSREYVQSVLHNYDSISSGIETLIVAEEIDNANDHQQIEE